VAIYVRTPKAAERVNAPSAVHHREIETRGERGKSEVSRPWHSKYLGFRITRYMGKTRTGIHAKSLQKFRRKVREITARERGQDLTRIVGELNSYVRGWADTSGPTLGDAGRGPSTLDTATPPGVCVETVETTRTRVRNLMARGIARHWAMMVGNTRKGPWR